MGIREVLSDIIANWNLHTLAEPSKHTHSHTHAPRVHTNWQRKDSGAVLDESLENLVKINIFSICMNVHSRQHKQTHKKGDFTH